MPEVFRAVFPKVDAWGRWVLIILFLHFHFLLSKSKVRHSPPTATNILVLTTKGISWEGQNLNNIPMNIYQ